jgi:hypothetical protein
MAYELSLAPLSSGLGFSIGLIIGKTEQYWKGGA